MQQRRSPTSLAVTLCLVRCWPRAKYADGVPRKVFDASNLNLAALIRVWTAAVVRKGLDCKWLKIKHEWDVPAAHGMYAKIARVSLAHWLAGQSEQCHGT